MPDFYVLRFGIRDPLHASDVLSVTLLGEGVERHYELTGPGAIAMAQDLQARLTQPFSSPEEFTDKSRAMGLSVRQL